MTQQLQQQPLDRLSAAGVAIWLDDLNRDRLADGSLAGLVQEKHLVGVTSNPTIFAKAVRSGSRYDDQLRDLASRGIGVEEAARLLTAYDVRWGCDVLRPVYDATNRQDGRVSLEVDPRLAHNTEATIAEARALWWLVDRPNLFIKIPATEAGLPAITAALADGISVNVTLIFSLYRYEQVIEAFLQGIQRAQQAGHDLGAMASVASFFVSRVDTETDARLDEVGTPEAAALRGKAAIANARLAYRLHERSLADPRWREPAAAGAHSQRPLWASTGVKDPAYDDTRYVDQLVAPGVVSTMPEKTLAAVADHGGDAEDSVHGTYEEARATLDALERLGIPYDDVVRVLEEEGVEKFTASWNELLETLSAAL